MADSLEYLSVIDIQTALKNISIGGGYNHNVDAGAVSVDPADHIEVLTGALSHAPFFIVEVSPGREIGYSGGNQTREFIPLDVTAAHDAEQLDPTSRLSVFQQLCADIEKAITVDITRGGRVTDTRIVEKQMGMMVGGQRVIAVVQLELRLHRTYGSPNG